MRDVRLARCSWLIVWASTSGHTEYVVDRLVGALRDRDEGLDLRSARAETVELSALARSDLLVLASSTWNTGAIEGQLNPHMAEFIRDRCRDLQLQGKRCACIGLGDHRYLYRARAAAELERFVEDHGGRFVSPTLRIVDEPYGQERAVTSWARDLLAAARGTRAGR